jgi:hypothetical protein
VKLLQCEWCTVGVEDGELYTPRCDSDGIGGSDVHTFDCGRIERLAKAPCMRDHEMISEIPPSLLMWRI